VTVIFACDKACEYFNDKLHKTPVLLCKLIHLLLTASVASVRDKDTV